MPGSLFQIEILVMVKNEHATSWRSAPDTDPLAYEDSPTDTKELGAHLIAERKGVESAVEHHVSERRSLSDSFADPNPQSASSSLRKQFRNDEDCNLVLKMQKSAEDGKFKERDDFPTPSNSSSQVHVVRTLLISGISIYASL